MLRKFNDPILKTVCEPVKPGDSLAFLRVMQEALIAAKNGVGLAAPQIGVAKRVIIVWPRRNRRTIMLNPAILERGGEVVAADEQCLSFPGITATVERHTWLLCEWFDQQFKRQTGVVRDFEARVVQHEIDHLDGICRVGERWLELTAAA